MLVKTPVPQLETFAASSHGAAVILEHFAHAKVSPSKVYLAFHHLPMLPFVTHLPKCRIPFVANSFFGF